MKPVSEIYRATRAFPKEEIYGLTAQLRRAGVSVPSNVAEGHGRTSRREFHQFVGQARGSLTEVETQLEIAEDLGYLDEAVAVDLLKKASEIARMLNGLLVWTERSQTTRSQ
jgi:four helix bundle protein